MRAYRLVGFMIIVVAYCGGSHVPSLTQEEMAACGAWFDPYLGPR
jgi:hypothetical protein